LKAINEKHRPQIVPEKKQIKEAKGCNDGKKEVFNREIKAVISKPGFIFHLISII